MPRMRSVVFALLVLVIASCDAAQEPADTTTPTPTTATTSTTDTTDTTDASSTTTQDTSTTTAPPPDLPPLEGLAYETVIPDAAFPMVMTARPGDAESWLGLREGTVWTVTADGERDEVLDISDRVTTDGERGLLGMALHPDDPNVIFLHYSDRSGDTTVSRFTVDDGDEEVLLTVDQPAANHNGGMLQFGPDGALYVALGDGGGSNDRFGHGQNQDSLLGGMVRIDVATGEAELWAYGLRNPWRTWFDTDGALYIADVGQNAYEEVNVVVDPPAGLNYGWPITEGLHCFSPSSDCDTEGITLPVLEVEHGDAGTCSITGGIVYRGEAIPEYEGHYFYSDFCGGWLRSFLHVDGEATEETDHSVTAGIPGSIVSFGVDGAGEMYVLTTNAVLRVVPLR